MAVKKPMKKAPAKKPAVKKAMTRGKDLKGLEKKIGKGIIPGRIIIYFHVYVIKNTSDQ